jgi:hypothetical protein
MDGNTRARKEARLARLRAQVAELEQELAVLHISETDGEADATDSAASAASVAVPGEQAWEGCSVAVTTEEDEASHWLCASLCVADRAPIQIIHQKIASAIVVWAALPDKVTIWQVRTLCAT